MANGVNHAKQLVLNQVTDLAKEADGLAHDLQNGKSGDLHVISKALVLVIKTSNLTSQMMAAIYPLDIVTMDVCQEQHRQLTITKKSKFKIGPLEFEGVINPTSFLAVVSLVLAGVFVVGKIENWW